MSFYHNIFKNKQTFDTPVKLSLLIPYFPVSEIKPVKLSEEFVETNTNNQEKSQDEKPETKVLKEVIIENKPEEKNILKKSNVPCDLFWVMYIDIYGYDTYLKIGRKYDNVEIEEKQKICDFINKNVVWIKEKSNHKLTKVMINYMASIVICNKSFSLEVLPALAFYYKKRIIIYKYLDNGFGVYLDFNICDEELKETIIIEKNKCDYKVNEKMDIETVNEKMLCLDSITRSLKAVSNYNVSEINRIASLVGIHTDKKWLKQELYMEVLRVIGSF
jgi:hypothetical protein